MKFCFSVLILMLVATSASCQDLKKNAVKINALGLAVGLGSFVYERRLSDDFSISITPSVGAYNTTGFDYRTFGIGGEFRYYFLPAHSTPKGLHAGIGGNTLFGNAVFDKVPPYDFKTKVNGFNTFFNVGYQHIFRNNIMIDAGGGIQYVRFKFQDSQQINFGDEAYKGFLPNVVLSVGYAF